MLAWEPLRVILALQQQEGAFASLERTSTANPTFFALSLMGRCGMALSDEPWVREAVETVDGLAVEGKIILSKNYPTKLLDPLPFESVGEPSRFLTYQWLRAKRLWRLP